MKPNEILGMVEEAAGTRMYETKRVAALKTIDKKQMKVDELNSVLAEEITPTLERLRGEKQSYLKWSKNSADIERIERFVIANEFMRAQQALDSNVEGSTEMEDKVAELEEKANACRDAIAEKEKEIAALSSKLSGEFESVHTNAKQTEEKRAKELVKVTSAWQNSSAIVKTAENDLKEAKTSLAETASAIATKEREMLKESERIEQAKEEAMEAEKRYEQLKSDYQNMSAGIASSQGDEGRTLPDQICKAHSDSKSAEAKAKQAKMKIDHLTKEIKVRLVADTHCEGCYYANSHSRCIVQCVEKEMKAESKSAASLAKKRDNAQAKVEDIKGRISSLDFSETEYNSLDSEKIALESSVSDLEETVETLSAQLEGRLAFNYSDPVYGFDRTKVKGLVARLIKLKKAEHSTALEVVAGGKLYQVVVDEVITGKALLSKGKLERRVTIIPLDKIQPRRVTVAACEKANEIAAELGSSASPAIELVGFDEEVRNAMEYVFGSTLVVDGTKAANQICDSTKTRAVTLDGDVYDPSGTISGGSKNSLGSTLSKLSELTQASRSLSEKKAQLHVVMAKLDAMKSLAREFEKLSDRLDLATAELSGVEKHLSQTLYGMVLERFEAMSAEMKEATAEYEKMEKEKESKWSLYHELKDREVELTKERESRLKDIDIAVKEAKKVAAEKAKAAREVSNSKDVADFFDRHID